MVTNIIDHRGLVTTGPYNGSVTSTVISGSTVSIENFAGVPGVEIYQCTGTQDFTGDAVHNIVRFNGDLATVRKGINFWNPVTHIFQPTKTNQVYSFRVSGILSASSGAPVFHLDIELSGGIATGIASHHEEASINRQSHDFDVVKGSSFDHSHFSFCGFILANEDVVVSGVQFYGAMDGNQTVTLQSCSLGWKEG